MRTISQIYCSRRRKSEGSSVSRILAFTFMLMLCRGFHSRSPWYNLVVTHILEALEFLHSKKAMVVHRDIAPRNILYQRRDQRFQFILAGFSLARIIPPEKDEYKERRAFLYLAPEVYQGQEETFAVDVWSLGILCLDILRLVPQILYPNLQSFASFKRANWCDTMCDLASHSERPEVEMMVHQDPMERSYAASVLDFIRHSSNTQVQRYRPSVDLLNFIFHEDTSFSHLTPNEIREFAESYLDNPRPPPAPTANRAHALRRRRRSPSASTTGAQESVEVSVGTAALRLLRASLQEAAVHAEAVGATAQLVLEETGFSPNLTVNLPNIRGGERTSAEGREGAGEAGVSAALSKASSSTSISLGELQPERSTGGKPFQKQGPKTQESPRAVGSVGAQATEVRGQPSDREQIQSQQGEAKSRSRSPPSRPPERLTQRSDVEAGKPSLVATSRRETKSQIEESPARKISPRSSSRLKGQESPRISPRSGEAQGAQGSAKSEPHSLPSAAQPRGGGNVSGPSRQADTPFQPGEGKTKQLSVPPDTRLKDQESPHISPRTTPRAGKAEARTAQRSAKAKQITPHPASSQPPTGRSPPTSSCRIQTQPEQSKTRDQQTSPPSGSRSQIPGPSLPPYRTTEAGIEQEKVQSKPSSPRSGPQPQNPDPSALPTNPSPVQTKSTRSKAPSPSPAPRKARQTSPAVHQSEAGPSRTERPRQEDHGQDQSRGAASSRVEEPTSKEGEESKETRQTSPPAVQRPRRRGRGGRDLNQR